MKLQEEKGERRPSSPDQVEAMDAIRAWWQRGTPQTFTLAGYAGTGKTTVISRLLEDWPGGVVIGAPTGKAALRLREKGVHAETIYRLAYKLAGKDADGDPLFEYVGLEDDSAEDLVVVDEASMVNSDIYADLLSGGYRILFVGDHGQLPPIGGDPGIMQRPDFTLREIHRQDDQGLLDFAHALREGQPRPKGRGAAQTIRIPPTTFGDVDGGKWVGAVVAADIVICWRNATRHWLNHLLMRQRGVLPKGSQYSTGSAQAYLRHALEERNELRLVCLRNDYHYGVMNGMVVRARLLERIDAGDGFVAEIRDDLGGPPREVKVAAWGFMAERGVEPDRERRLALFDFGYCLTAHKAQGSEWDSVAVFDDTFATMEDRARWAYTAATRAKKQLAWIHR